LKKTLANLTSPTVFKRKNVKRKTERHFNKETAASAICTIEKSCEIFGFTKGQFSKIDVIEHVLAQTGPADVTICTWSASSGDIRRASNFLSNKFIKSLKFIVDVSFKVRQPAYLKELIDNFGTEAIRLTVVHAKFALIRNEKFNVIIRTSMNLNYNPRFENFEISENKFFADFMQNIVDEIWSNSDVSEKMNGNDQMPEHRAFVNMYLKDGLDKQNMNDLTRCEL